VKIALAASAALCLAAPALAAPIEDAIETITGHYAQGETTLHAVPIELAQTADAVYLELSTAREELDAAQLILTFHEAEGGPIVRVLSFPELRGDLMAEDPSSIALGMWALPDMFPALNVAQFHLLGETVIADGSGEVRVALDRAPNASAEAPYINLDLSFTGDRASWSRVGLDWSGGEVWSERFESMSATEADPDIIEGEDGLKTIVIRRGEGIELAEGDMLAFNYFGMLEDARRFDATQDFPRRGTTSLRYPNMWGPLAEALRGVKNPMKVTPETVHQREIRKAVIPPEAGFGEMGNGPVPPNETLYYLIVVESILDKTPE
jgi:hypothetical protein